MFNSMKNQFKEKTGRELPKFTPQKGGLSRQSRQGSESSVCSLVLEQQLSPSPSSPPQELQKAQGQKDVNALAKKDEEWKVRMEKTVNEWKQKLEKREAELLQSLVIKEEEWRKKEMELTDDLLKQTNELKEALKVAEDKKRLLCQFQEEKDTLESFQTQEMAKIKHLLLAKEKECSETTLNLKEMTTLVESLKTEVSRLRPFEEQVSNYEDDLELLRHTSEKERWNLSSKLAQSEEQVRHLTDRVALLTRRSESDAAGLVASLPPDDRVQAFLGERALLERRLEEAHVHLADIKASWSAQIASLETQVGRLSRQAGEEGSERRLAEAKVSELEAKLEDEIKEKEHLLGRVKSLTEECNSLAAEVKSSNALIASKDEKILELSKKVNEIESSSKESLENSKTIEANLKETNEKYELCLKEIQKCKDEYEKLKTKCELDEQELCNVQGDFKNEKTRLESALKQEQEKSSDLIIQLEKERNAKDDALFQNAQVSQEVDMARQDLRQQQVDVEEYLKKVNILEKALKDKDQSLSKTIQEMQQLSSELENIKDMEKSTGDVEKGLRDKIADLEEQVTEKNKAIKVLKQKLADMKKTLQKELKVGENDGAEIMNNHNHLPKSSLKENGDNEVNFLYMKNVIMKFLTSREYEALHLTKAVATLLKLSAEEECLLKDTIGWRMSWFRSKPPKLEDYAS